MKRLPLFGLLLTLTALTSCFNNSVYDEYKDWREDNEQWYAEQAALTDPERGGRYYTALIAAWDPSAQVLIHWYNDTAATRHNLKPLFSSTVDVKYRGTIKDGTPFDSSYVRTTPADSIFRCRLNSNIIEGWAIAITHMHVGDSCRIIVPYMQAYGSSKVSDVVIPFSDLMFDIKLVDIHAYETH